MSDEKPKADDSMRNEKGHFLPGHPKTPGCGQKKGHKSLTHILRRVCSDEQPSQEELTDICEQMGIPEYMRDEIAMATDRLTVFARVMVRLGQLGDINMLREVLGRLDPIRKEISGPGGTPIRTQAVGIISQTDPASAKETYQALLEQEGTGDPDDPEDEQ